jgi:hypothetical protein
MRHFRSWRGRLGAFVVTLVLALVVIYAVGAIRNNSASSSSSSSSPAPQGIEDTNGPASFIGHASNAVMFIQWTRAGDSISGSLQEAITKRPAGSGLSSEDKSFTGIIHGSGLTLNTQGSEASAYVGEARGSGFILTVPGQDNSLIKIEFSPGEVSSYNAATRELLVGEYQSPCSLYVVSHDVRLTITGPNAAEACESFVEKAGARAEWTTSPQTGALESDGVVCEETNRANEKAVVTDSGGQEYGQEACAQLSGEGWG